MENTNAPYGRVTGIFMSEQDAGGIYDSLLDRGFTHEEISVVMSDVTHKNKFQSRQNSQNQETHAAEDAGRGALIGGATGGIVSAVAAITTNLALPGLGLVFVGPLLAGLAGAAAGSIAGGTIGAIVGSGYPKEHAEYYETSIRDGGVMISVNPRSAIEKELIIADFKRHNGQKVYADDNSIVLN